MGNEGAIEFSVVNPLVSYHDTRNKERLNRMQPKNTQKRYVKDKPFLYNKVDIPQGNILDLRFSRQKSY